MARNENMLNPAEIGLDTPLRLSDAVKIAFPNGSLTVSGLRKDQCRWSMFEVRQVSQAWRETRRRDVEVRR